jgi:hypothetical protein
VLLRLLALDRLPFEEPVDRHDAAALGIGIPERGQIPHRLALGVDWLAAALRIFAPIRDKAPTQRVERYLAGLVLAADDQQALARRGVPPWRIVVDAAVSHVHAIDDGIPKRLAALDDPPAHATRFKHLSAGIPEGARPAWSALSVPGSSGEGIVSKRLGSPYRSGRLRDWIKTKNPAAPAVKREAEEDWGRERWR